MTFQISTLLQVWANLKSRMVTLEKTLLTKSNSDSLLKSVTEEMWTRLNDTQYNNIHQHRVAYKIMTSLFKHSSIFLHKTHHSNRQVLCYIKPERRDVSEWKLKLPSTDIFLNSNNNIQQQLLNYKNIRETGHQDRVVKSSKRVHMSNNWI